MSRRTHLDATEKDDRYVGNVQERANIGSGNRSHEQMALTRPSPGDPTLERKLARAIEGEVRFDRLTRGLYSTDASHYQVEPLGVVFPRSIGDVQAILEVARSNDVPVLPRGGGTSQCGQTIGRAIVLDTHRHLNGVGTVEALGYGEESGIGSQASFSGRIDVEPGVVLDHLNAALTPGGIWFPVDPSTGSRATLGGMAGNNSAGSRSIHYGMMVDNVIDLEVILADGRRLWLGDSVRTGCADIIAIERERLQSLYRSNEEEIRKRQPRTMRNVAGYNLNRIGPGAEALARLLVGSEGTLAFFSKLRLGLAELPRKRVLGLCHFPDLIQALDSVQHLVSLGPSAVELVDSNVLTLAAGIPDFRSTIARFVRGTPGALLLVEFSSPDPGAELERELGHLDGLMTEIGYPSSVTSAITSAEQAAIWNVRKAGLNIVMSMAGHRKPISFIEDCAVPLEHLAEYAMEVNAIFRRHGTDGTWYAHASVGCLHVRPALNLRDPEDIALVRRIAEETHEVVRRFGGTHSGEHGDGILRSEFLPAMVGEQLTRAYREVKDTMDPLGILNPGKIVDAPKMDEPSLFRFHPQYDEQKAEKVLPTVLSWGPGGLLGATERCNNNGACRKTDPGIMCPSFRATRQEQHSTRGRANALRLALSGQLGDSGLDSPEMVEAMSLCISCKGCARECPAGVDMSRMKIEWQHRRNRVTGIPLRERLLGALPRIAPRIARLSRLLNLASDLPGKRLLGLTQKRRLPRWSEQAWRDQELESVASSIKSDAEQGSAGIKADSTKPQVALFVDTFSRWFEPEIPRAAKNLLEASGADVIPLRSEPGERPLCCGRTYLSAGMVDEAIHEAERLVNAARKMTSSDIKIVGLEPSCLYTLQDEIPALLDNTEAHRLAELSVTLEDYLDQAWEEGRTISFNSQAYEGPDGKPLRILRHGHCHQKAFGGVPAVDRMLARLPGVEATAIESGCCGMAGAFGYHAEHYETSMAIGELDVLPQVRAAEDDVRIIADGTSCRAQIEDGTGRNATHAAILLAEGLET